MVFMGAKQAPEPLKGRWEPDTHFSEQQNTYLKALWPCWGNKAHTRMRTGDTEARVHSWRSTSAAFEAAEHKVVTAIRRERKARVVTLVKEGHSFHDAAAAANWNFSEIVEIAGKDPRFAAALLTAEHLMGKGKPAKQPHGGAVEPVGGSPFREALQRQREQNGVSHTR